MCVTILSSMQKAACAYATLSAIQLTITLYSWVDVVSGHDSMVSWTAQQSEKSCICRLTVVMVCIVHAISSAMYRLGSLAGNRLYL